MAGDGRRPGLVARPRRTADAGRAGAARAADRGDDGNGVDAAAGRRVVVAAPRRRRASLAPSERPARGDGRRLRARCGDLERRSDRAWPVGRNHVAADSVRHRAGAPRPQPADDRLGARERPAPLPGARVRRGARRPDGAVRLSLRRAAALRHGPAAPRPDSGVDRPLPRGHGRAVRPAGPRPAPGRDERHGGRHARALHARGGAPRASRPRVAGARGAAASLVRRLDRHRPARLRAHRVLLGRHLPRRAIARSRGPRPPAGRMAAPAAEPAACERRGPGPARADVGRRSAGRPRGGRRPGRRQPGGRLG